ncbi:MAG: 50S ribosomal protein L32 [Candidatus Levybacteria bacterium RIFOXYC1_FULL_40_10]|nr:MAG: 50S ribosomal protein L32 [Candidatus Levybacteria bacterium RIFOXYC1_FULL_40_10]
MPQEPKKRHSRQRQGKRRAAIKLAMPASTDCLNCGAIIKPHTVCPKCGFYKTKQFLKIKTPKPVETPSENTSEENK